MSRLAWRFLQEGPLDVDISFFVCGTKGGASSLGRVQCFFRLVQTDRDRGGILYAYQDKRSFSKYTVLSFAHITVREPWVADNQLSIELILDYNPVIMYALDEVSRNEWLRAFRQLEKNQYNSTGKSKSRISADDLMATDLSIHFGEHLLLSPPKSSQDDPPASLIEAPRSGAEVHVLNARTAWTSPARGPVLVIRELVRLLQSLYEATDEGQRKDINPHRESDEWHTIADSQEFDHFVARSGELQVVQVENITEEQERCMFFVSAYSLLSMHAAAILKITLDEVVNEYDQRIAYNIGGRVYTLHDVTELSCAQPSTDTAKGKV
jgi:hypothetical protein